MTNIAKNINGLPYHAINSLLSICLEHDAVHLSEKTIQHIYERHPQECELCLEFIEAIIVAPDYIGQSPLHQENFVLIKQIMDLFLMIAICTVPNEYGKYPVMSSYIVPENTLQRRIRKGFLKPYKQKGHQ